MLMEKLTERQRAILEFLVHGGYSDMCFSFDAILDSIDEKLTKYQLSKEMKVLRGLELVEFHRGLLDDDGQAAGSGYCSSWQGAQLIERLETEDNSTHPLNK